MFTRLPSAAAGDPAELRDRFAFDRTPIASVAVDGMRTERPVAAELEKISAWISAVGAAVAMGDLDGNGRADDLCLSDPRTDTITVSPAHATERYRPFVLDVAPLHMDRTMAPMGCLPLDVDGDADTDVLTYYWGRTPVLFRHDPGPFGRGVFTPSELVPDRDQRWYTDTVLSTDVDGDGKLDLIVGNYFPDGARLLDPSAKFEPATQMQDSMSRAFNGGIDRIYLGDGKGGFSEARDVLTPDAAAGWTLAIGAQDLNGDLLPELYFAHDFGPDRLFVNRSTPGRVRLAEVRGEAGFAVPRSKQLGVDSFKGMGIDFADMNSDGHTDMFVSNISCEFGLMESNFAWLNTGSADDLDAGRAPFTDRSEDLSLSRSGWGWDAKFGDFDNDSVPELVQSTGFTEGTANLWPQVSELAMANDGLLRYTGAWMNHTPGWELAGNQDDQFFVRGPDGRWSNVADVIGLRDAGVSRGVATADVNGDGRLDLAVARQWAESFFYLNRGTGDERSTVLRLLLPQDGTAFRIAGGDEGDKLRGTPAIGATATVVLTDGRRLTAQVDGGNGHASVRSAELHFGLGTATPVSVELSWRDAKGAVRHHTSAVTTGRHTILLGA
ncbi:CRTAC1 family protein [Lentzea kentuckyensis]|uniref:CRTAC1 family protein n=1 Tax=Lentzea kentuckyensis TaxID=360086 RepID=UPI001179AF92|nr:CRTAC1 family protein [Lentzea kentuckyensis]